MKILKDALLLTAGVAIGTAAAPHIYDKMKHCHKDMKCSWKNARKHSKKLRRIARKTFKQFKFA